VIFAWLDGTSGEIAYHGDNHNHVQIDFSQPDGIPVSLFGDEESGLAARQLVNAGGNGVLITFQSEQAGAVGVMNYPYGSVADFADTNPSTGAPLLLLSDLERNVINFQTTPQCSLAITAQFNASESDAMMTSRTTLLGTLTLVDPNDLPAARAAYLAAHPLASLWIDFPDFNLYFFNISDVYWVGGFGNVHYIGYVDPTQYLSHVL